MSDTPRTDATMKFCFLDDREYVMAIFARELERQLAAVTKERDALLRTVNAQKYEVITRINPTNTVIDSISRPA